MIFLDNASTTKINEQVLETMINSYKEDFYNPSAIYKNGVNLSTKINQARNNIIKYLGGDFQDNLIFTSGATEANNLAILGLLKNNKKKLIFGSSEHPSIYNVAIDLKNKGYNVEFVKILPSGEIDLADFQKKVDADTAFISIMHICNETGVINDIKGLVKIAKSINKDVIFHSDGVQAVGKIQVNLKDLGVDLYTLSGHKIGAAKGIGALFVKNGINIKPILLGGGQENNLRSGTENVPAIMGFEKACELAIKNQKENYIKVSILYNKIIDNLKNSNLQYKINGDETSKYIISISFNNLRAETILHMFEQQDILIGNGSACSSKKSGNRILREMGVDKSWEEGSIRISLSASNSEEDINQFNNALIEIIREYKKNTNKR